MRTTILRGNIISVPALGRLDVTKKGYLAAEDGVIRGIYETLPEAYKGLPVEDYGDDLIVQSFSDMHLHGPQYPMVGMGMDLPLIDWLNTYTFPTEAAFSDPGFAREAYRCLAAELIRSGTTRVCMFSSMHREATLILMEELEKAGVTGFVGKVNMDRNGGENLEETTEESMRETLLWLEQCHFEHIKPILTPRFVPSCTNELMAWLGKLAKEKELPIQSHLSENRGEVTWVAELHPECRQYWEAYEQYGLWNNRTLMAHCVWSDEREREAIRRAGVWAVHCAASNQNLISGFAPIRVMLREGVNVVLGSDIAGGDKISMFDVVADTIRSSKARCMLDDWETPFLTVGEAWYLGTSAANPFFGEAPGFAPGNSLHALVLRDDQLVQTRPLTPQQRLERAVYRRQDNAVRAVYSAGRKVFSA